MVPRNPHLHQGHEVRSHTTLLVQSFQNMMRRVEEGTILHRFCSTRKLDQYENGVAVFIQNLSLSGHESKNGLIFIVHRFHSSHPSHPDAGFSVGDGNYEARGTGTGGSRDSEPAPLGFPGTRRKLRVPLFLWLLKYDFIGKSPKG